MESTVGKCVSVEVYLLENIGHINPSGKKVSGTPSTGTVQRYSCFAQYDTLF